MTYRGFLCSFTCWDAINWYFAVYILRRGA